MKAIVIAAIVLVPLAARAEEHTMRNAAEYSILAVSELTFAIDMLQTLDIKNHPGQHELNPLLGERPSDAKVVGYFAACMALNAGLFAVLPPKYRSIVPGVILVFESRAIDRNRAYGIGLQMPKLSF